MAAIEDKAYVRARLTARQATIEQISQIAGVAGASVGIIYHGEAIYTEHFVFRDIDAKKQADSDTMYGIGSCSKSYFAAAAAALVEEGKLSWTDPALKILKDLRMASEVATQEANLIDLAAHRLGLSGAFHLTFQGDGDHLIGPKNLWRYLPKLAPVASFRSKWLYNSHGYSILGEMLERVTGASVSDCLYDYVTKPLGLTRTMSRLDFATAPNLAKPYAALADGTPFELLHRQDFRGHFFEAAAGIYTSLTDVLKYAGAVMGAASELPDAAKGSIRVSGQYSHHIPVLNPSFLERSYALGWIRTQLPGVVGVMGDNLRILPIEKLPTIGCNTTPRLALYHQGATVGYFTSFYLFPETQSAVVVMTNSIANCDAADWIAQAMMQAVFDDQNQVDWIGVTKQFTQQCLQYYEDMQTKVEEQRQPGPPPRDMSLYVGDYYDNADIFFIRIRQFPGKDYLQLLFQGKEKHAYALRYFHDDVFEWTLTRDETAKRGRYHQFDPSYYCFNFHAEDGGKVNALSWRHDPNVPDPELFRKK
ncbi:beta-lactamase/transpeptidase-like protein [Byssothecium circinans]|uniref:Beta-lactamase/transpeptidase-like protein n=1 Tax=Byssothecium circinans TaxID=147558 RepID=A0A6A5U966_9PLEO|nr:beta-lactamase/transpeptidase-like protein [Byssothecium circinans]